jgi:hypothetical protein
MHHPQGMDATYAPTIFLIQKLIIQYKNTKTPHVSKNHKKQPYIKGQ